MKRAVFLIAVVVTLGSAEPAAAQLIDPYDGRNPFRCEPQPVGTGVDFPRPRVDPMCVVFDKTNQNLSELGIVDFLLNEPARLAGAAGKCFYFQRDEWRGSALAGGELELYHWRGRYFIDRAHGAGGVFVKALRLGGDGGDPALVESTPDPFRPYLHPTGGGGYASLDVDLEPRCVRRVDTPAEAREVYRRKPRPWPG